MSALQDYLPKDYQVPQAAGDYLKFRADGDYRIRAMGKPILGWEDWEEDAAGKKKPVRISYKSQKPSGEAKAFWALPIWNYAESKVQVLSITQKSIMLELEKLVHDADWGSLDCYDIKIRRETTKGGMPRYSVNPARPTSIPKAAVDSLKQRPCRVEALFHGLDPFGDDEFPEIDEVVESDAPSEDLQAQFVESLPKGIDVNKVEEFVGICASRNNSSKQKVYASAMVEMTRFVDVYQKWLGQRPV